MITTEDIITLYTYLSEQTLPEGSAIAKVYEKVTLIKEIQEKQTELRDLN